MRNYQWLSRTIAPLLPLWLFWRSLRGKEDRARLKERFGFASAPRPAGVLVWFHAASVGEASSILPMMTKMRKRFPTVMIVLTTGTVTSATLMARELPAGVIHQYVPVDTPQAVDRFIWHWRPDFALFVESEFWPNLIMAANDLGCFMGVINARMSEKTFRSWQKRPAMIKPLLAAFDIVFAQTENDAGRLRMLGARDTLCLGNIKYDAPALGCDDAAFIALQQVIGTRPVWLAASTHPGEEIMIAQAHRLLAATRPNLLTLIVPRHPARGVEIAQELQTKGSVAIRSKGETIAANTAFYVADTLGELGLFYRLSEIVFMGGSLVAHGGQNPMEPTRLKCALLVGPHTHNFADIYSELEAAGGCVRVQSAAKLAAEVDALFNDLTARDRLQARASEWLATKGGATDKILELLEPALRITPQNTRVDTRVDTRA